ncbi:hypothetical protein myaer87_05230 [Microcystis aeruginosa NIES-87]|uniref:PEP-CTERM sorting domain-containing protein n=1 Tax=Microcystis TaxID=1125 RepID=UPI000CC131B9|nr:MULTISPECIES: PEP-CTERM sorting domain-containing protein [Microcystis]WNF13030.1 PEP-CTERM sorting domain-containing protein [Microcystis aeruginosa NRERC-214]GBE73296.1 hypothetical protein myaer87_05230 [Microcystis aeruginosa NIES-87]
MKNFNLGLILGITVATIALCPKNVTANSFTLISLTDTKDSFTATFQWDGQIEPGESLFFAIDRNDFPQIKCAFNGGVCWDFYVAFSDNQINGLDFFASAQHKVPADDGDSDEGDFFTFSQAGDKIVPGLITQKTVGHEHNPAPNHRDLYSITLSPQYIFVFTGNHIGSDINISIPEPSTALSLLALGTLGAASTLKRKLKPSQLTEKETTKVS